MSQYEIKNKNVEIDNNSINEIKYNVKDEFQTKTLEENRNYVQTHSHQDAILALNPASWYNIGMMIRSAFLFGFSKFIILGRSQYDKRTAVGTQHYMEIEKFNIMEGIHNEHFSPEKMISYLKNLENEYMFIFIEQTEHSIMLQNALEHLQNHYVDCEKKKLFIFGTEADGIPKKVLEHYSTKLCIEIPQLGIGRSHNISNAMSIVLWEFYKNQMN